MSQIGIRNNKNKRQIPIKILTIIAILAVIAIIYYFMHNLQTIKIDSEEYEFFQYVMGKKIEYSGILEISNKNDITKLETKEGTIYLDSIPVYYKSEIDKAILPIDMAVVFPMNHGKMNKINSLSTAYIEHGDVYLKKGNLNRKVEDAFLYDGNDLYFFLENTVVDINNTKYKLPSLSYANVTYGGYVELYNYDRDEYTFIEAVDTDIMAYTNQYTINLSNDTVQYEGNDQILLKRIKNLTNLENK